MLDNKCPFLNKCVGSVEKCPFFKNKRSYRNCGMFGILSAVESYRGQYNGKDAELIDKLVHEFIASWREAVAKNIRAPGKVTGMILEKWIYTQLRDVLGDSLRRNKKVPMDFGEWRADIVYYGDKSKTIIKVKMYIDLQHSLMTKALLDYSDYKWIFITFHKPYNGAERILDLISKAYEDRFLYVYLVKEPYKALKYVLGFITDTKHNQT